MKKALLKAKKEYRKDVARRQFFAFEQDGDFSSLFEVFLKNAGLDANYPSYFQKLDIPSLGCLKKIKLNSSKWLNRRAQL